MTLGLTPCDMFCQDLECFWLKAGLSFLSAVSLPTYLRIGFFPTADLGQYQVSIGVLCLDAGQP